MGEVTKIAWCDHTFNAWIGCEHASPGCLHCYAEAQNKLWNWTGGGWGVNAPRRVTSDSNWAKLRAWDRKAERAGVMRRVFVNSLSDTFDVKAPIGARERLWKEIEACTHLEFLLLTKRPENWKAMLPGSWREKWPARVRLGFTAEDQQRFDERFKFAAELLGLCREITPFFLSCEPMLGTIDLRDTERWLLGWVICGGESTPLARPMHPDWARRLRDQCADAGIPFLFKQWGEWAPKTICHILKPEYAGKLIQMVTSVSSNREDEGQISYWAYPSEIKEQDFGPLDRMMRVGKEKPEPLLDGREWMEFPGVKVNG
jgi:protein gp37